MKYLIRINIINKNINKNINKLLKERHNKNQIYIQNLLRVEWMTLILHLWERIYQKVNKDQQDFDNKSKAVSDDTQKLNRANSELQTKTDAKNAAE